MKVKKYTLPRLAVTDRHNPFDVALASTLANLKREPTLLNACEHVRVLIMDMQIEQALSLLDECEPFDNPTVCYYRGLALLHNGDLPVALRELEHRLTVLSDLPSFRKFGPKWHGGPTMKRVLFWQEGGLGDTLHFLRYLPAAVKRCPNSALVVKSILHRLLVANGIPERVLLKDAGIQTDYQCSLLSLPHLLGDYTISGNSYLTAPPEAVSKWNKYADRVGFVFKGNPEHTCDLIRSIPDEDISEVLTGKDWVPVDLESTGAKDWWDLAGIVANLKLLVAVDTGIVHLAGALGKPCWLLLNKTCDWRWVMPWYDSVRVFRCAKHSEWKPVFAKIAAELANGHYRV